MIVYDTNGEQPLSAMISMITKVCLCSVFFPPVDVIGWYSVLFDTSLSVIRPGQSRSGHVSG